MSVAGVVGQVFWLAAAVAVTATVHMVLVKKDWFAALRRPIDGGRTLGGKRIFGDNKTWRGLVVMVVGAALFGAAQGAAGGAWAERSGAACIDFGAVGERAGVARGVAGFAVGYAIVNAVLGLGYALGELPNSFLKRRIDIVPGKTGGGIAGAFFLVLDQADSVIAALGLGALLFPWGWRIVLAGVVCMTLFHFAGNAVTYLVGVRRNL